MNWRASQAVVHTSGALSTDVLESAARQGAAVGSLHPLQTFAGDEDDHGKLRGSVFGVEAEGDLRETLLEIVQDLGGTAIELRGEDKVLYHAAAVLVSNYTVTLMKLATDLWLRLGWERPAAVNALLPLLQGTVDNLARSGVPAALTGPIARGDVETVERHLEALSKAAPDIVAAYRELAIQAIPVALAGGTLSNSDALLLRGLLEAKPDTATSEGAKT